RVIPMVSAADIGPVIAEFLLGTAPRERRIVELAGPKDVCAKDLASALSALLSRPVEAVQAPLDAVVPTFTSFGFSENIAGLFREMYVGIANGTVDWERAPGTIARRGSTSVSETFARLLRG